MHVKVVSEPPPKKNKKHRKHKSKKKKKKRKGEKESSSETGAESDVDPSSTPNPARTIRARSEEDVIAETKYSVCCDKADVTKVNCVN